MKIRLVSKETTWGGGEVLMVGLARELQQQGHEVSIEAPLGSQMASKAVDLCSTGRSGTPDLVIANDFRSVWRSAIHWPTARMVFICHGWWQTSWLRNRACGVLGVDMFAVSSPVADAIREAGGVREPADVLPLGPDTVHFRPPTPEERRLARAHLVINRGDEIVMSWVGRFQDVKRPSMFVDLVEALDVMGLMVVPEKAANAAEQRVLDVLLDRCSSAKIVLMPGGDPRLAYWASDVFVSTSKFESLGLALMEALACGLPAITTAVGGPRDFLPEVWRIPEHASVDLIAERLWAAIRNRSLIYRTRQEMIQSRSMSMAAQMLTGK